jgi:hypothetical protein
MKCLLGATYRILKILRRLLSSCILDPNEPVALDDHSVALSCLVQFVYFLRNAFKEIVLRQVDQRRTPLLVFVNKNIPPNESTGGIL